MLHYKEDWSDFILAQLQSTGKQSNFSVNCTYSKQIYVAENHPNPLIMDHHCNGWLNHEFTANKQPTPM